MKRYEQYKYSGVAWIGEIPAHWKVCKTKYVANLYTGNSLNDSQKEEYTRPVSDDTLPYIATKDIVVDKDIINYFNGINIPKNGALKIAPVDTFLLCVEGGSAGKKMAYNTSSAYFVNKLCCFESRINPRFHYYFIKSHGYANIFKQSIQGLIGGVSVSTLNNLEIAIPSNNEQQAIVRYLDYKVAKIDKLIAENEAQVKELEKYRTAVISEVVTKGLNPNVPMRDSGIQWIGEIPAHWEVKRLKHFTRLITDGTHQTPDYIDDGIPFLSIKDVSSGSIDFSDVKYISLHQHNELSKHAPIEKGDILFTRIGTLGVFVIVDCNQAFDIFVSLGLIKLKQGLINTNFLVYYLSSHNVKEYILLVKAGEGTSAAKFNLSDVASTPVVLPPNYEQQQIVDILANKCKKIDESLRRIKTQIEELKAYKIALISEAVTGQIDVRDWQEK